MQLGASAHLVVVLPIVGLMVLVAGAGHNDFGGKVGDYEYDLIDLAKRIGGAWTSRQSTRPATPTTTGCAA